MRWSIADRQSMKWTILLMLAYLLGLATGYLPANRRANQSRELALRAVLLAEQAGIVVHDANDAAMIWRIQCGK